MSASSFWENSSLTALLLGKVHPQALCSLPPPPAGLCNELNHFCPPGSPLNHKEFSTGQQVTSGGDQRAYSSLSLCSGFMTLSVSAAGRRRRGRAGADRVRGCREWAVGMERTGRGKNVGRAVCMQREGADGSRQTHVHNPDCTARRQRD